VKSTYLGGILMRAFPKVEWEMHHVYVQQAWSRVGSSNLLFPDDAIATEGLRRLGNGLWNLLPVPKIVNRTLGANNATGEFMTEMVATAYYSLLVFGPTQTMLAFGE